MPRRVEEHWEQLEKLKKAKSKKTTAKILKQGGKPLQLCLRECAINILNGKVPLTPNQKKQLCRYKDHLRRLRNKSTRTGERLQIEQKGGFLPALIAPILGAVVGGLLKRKS